ncbi:class I SAM-dependent methyltransferase [Ktedonospora formicarum]|uniref:class I SAM-dependent methyltransferase n=1 Tax=Ktedonospora formicarum TaxID=2778364 RepID=UPI001C68B6DB|nr:class I SAM-dependent methyltransferase [Ktedonospora formicarum]
MAISSHANCQDEHTGLKDWLKHAVAQPLRTPLQRSAGQAIKLAAEHIHNRCVIGIDLSEEMMQAATKHNGASRQNAASLETSSSQMPGMVLKKASIRLGKNNCCIKACGAPRCGVMFEEIDEAQLLLLSQLDEKNGVKKRSTEPEP